MERNRLTPLAIAAAVFVAAGGFIHLREWLETYRDLPDDVPGAWVVKIGFPIDVGLSLLAIVALLAAVWLGRWLTLVGAGIIAFQAGSIIAAIVSREASLFGWTETGYRSAVSQALAVQAGAILCAAALLGVERVRSTD